MLKPITIFFTGSLLCALMATGALAAPAPKEGTMRDVATCRDGKTYRNTTGRHMGACSGHGGVAKWADGSPVKSHTKTTEYK